MPRNEYEERVFRDEVYEDAKNENFNPPHEVNVGTDIVSGFISVYDDRYKENAEYREEFDKASEALKRK
jgi:hypothetical protein